MADENVNRDTFDSHRVLIVVIKIDCMTAVILGIYYVSSSFLKF